MSLVHPAEFFPVAVELYGPLLMGLAEEYGFEDLNKAYFAAVEIALWALPHITEMTDSSLIEMMEFIEMCGDDFDDDFRRFAESSMPIGFEAT